MGKEYIQYIYFTVYLKLTQYYKSTILQLKKRTVGLLSKIKILPLIAMKKCSAIRCGEVTWAHTRVNSN